MTFRFTMDHGHKFSATLTHPISCPSEARHVSLELGRGDRREETWRGIEAHDHVLHGGQVERGQGGLWVQSSTKRVTETGHDFLASSND